MGGWDRQTWQQEAFRLCGPWDDVHLPCNRLIVITILHSVFYRPHSHCKRGCLSTTRDAKRCSPVCLPHESSVQRTELVLHGEIAWALTGFICSICMFLSGMLSLGFIFIIKGLSAAQFWCNAGRFWNPGEVCVMLRCICLSGSLKRSVEAKPKSLDRHDHSEHSSSCNEEFLQHQMRENQFLQYYLLWLYICKHSQLVQLQNYFL